ncbi:hypothetical protein [Aeoliella sp. SH292]|uniref:hypothetical protein n=1 Tax=Aeoliella sp. SH292 TaxID=3454464 RepID=UPI003F9B7CF7
MEALIPILIQLVGGAAGGNVVAALLKNINLNKVIATITGLIGGVAGGQIANVLPMLEELMKGDAGMAANGGIAAGGGALLTFIVGMIQKSMAGGTPSN